MAENLDDIQPKMDKSTEPRLDVSKEPQTMSMQHHEKGDARLDQASEAPEGDEETGNKTSLLWNE
ncbi:MAG TPA: hypothetical protein VF636_03420 [Sphingomonas sp.]